MVVAARADEAILRVDGDMGWRHGTYWSVPLKFRGLAILSARPIVITIRPWLCSGVSRPTRLYSSDLKCCRLLFYALLFPTLRHT